VAHPVQGGSWAVGNRRFCRLLNAANVHYRASSSLMHLSSFARPVQSYLARFTDKGTKEGQFFVLEVESGRTFRTSPQNVAVELDFNRVDIDGHPPDVIETAFSQLEQEAGQAIANIVATGKFPNDEDCNSILNLICLIAVRNPFFRKSFNRAREQTIHIIGDLLVSDEKLFDHHVQKARENGEKIPDSISFEEMKRFIEGRNYEIELSPEGNLRVELNTFDKILPILGERTWSLIIAPSDGPEFICSDHPVTINWKSGRQGPIGLGSRESEVFFPLSRRVGFYGTFENPLKEVVHAKRGNVATMNRRLVFNAERHVFSSQKSFVLWIDGEIKTINCGYNRVRGSFSLPLPTPPGVRVRTGRFPKTSGP